MTAWRFNCILKSTFLSPSQSIYSNLPEFSFLRICNLPASPHLQSPKEEVMGDAPPPRGCSTSRCRTWRWSQCQRSIAIRRKTKYAVNSTIIHRVYLILCTCCVLPSAQCTMRKLWKSHGDGSAMSVCRGIEEHFLTRTICFLLINFQRASFSLDRC